MLEITEIQINRQSIAEQRVGAIIQQAQARSLLGRASGGFLRRVPKHQETPEERSHILFNALSQRRDQLDGTNNVEALYASDNKLGDSFLPSLRSFVPAHNVTKMNKEMQATKTELFKQQKRSQEQRAGKIKQIEKTREPE